MHSVRQPLGVVGIISPFNFPAMVPMWFFPIAIAAGNTVVVKPSEKVPTASLWMAELWKEAGLPDGVFNVLNGDKVAVDGLLTHPDVQSVSFVGSTPIARYVYETGTSHGKRVQALGGAKNHMLVLPDADLDLAADQAVNAGYGSAGERCMAISAVRGGRGDRRRAGGEDQGTHGRAAHRRRHPRLRHGTAGHRARPGTGCRATSTPARRPAPPWWWTAARSTPTPTATGFFVGPTLFDHVGTDMSIYTDEIFGPVLSVVRVDSYAEGVELINANPYGNGTAIFTNDGGAARQFSNEVKVGMIGVNVPGPGADGVLLLRRLEVLAVRRHPRARRWRASTSSPAARSSPPAGSTRATAASTWASRRTSDPLCSLSLRQARSSVEVDSDPWGNAQAEAQLGEAPSA